MARRKPVTMAETMAESEKLEDTPVAPEYADMADMSPSELTAALAQARQDLADLHKATAGGTKIAPEVFMEKFGTDEPGIRGYINLKSEGRDGITYERTRTDFGYTEEYPDPGVV